MAAGQIDAVTPALNEHLAQEERASRLSDAAERWLADSGERAEKALKVAALTDRRGACVDLDASEALAHFMTDAVEYDKLGGRETIERLLSAVARLDLPAIMKHREQLMAAFRSYWLDLERPRAEDAAADLAAAEVEAEAVTRWEDRICG